LLETGTEILDCWNKIGVRGDKTCPELESHAHCRNCPAYSAAALTLLDREATEAPGPAASGGSGECAEPGECGADAAIVFRIGAEWFALSTVLLDEVVGLRAIHSLPHRRNPALLGLANVRGELVACVSLARLLAGEAVPITQGRLIVVRHSAGRLAFPVDEVQHIHRYDQEALEPVPVTVGQAASTFTIGLLSWRDRTIGFLDGSRLLEAFDRSLG
jgi:chemotaxis signal transduction protein